MTTLNVPTGPVQALWGIFQMGSVYISLLGKEGCLIPMKTVLEPSDIEAIATKVAELLATRLNVGKDVEEIFDKKMLAKYLHVNVSWVDKSLHIPHFNVGKYVRFKRSHIDKWIENLIRPKKVTGTGCPGQDNHQARS